MAEVIPSEIRVAPPPRTQPTEPKVGLGGSGGRTGSARDRRPKRPGRHGVGWLLRRFLKYVALTAMGLVVVFPIYITVVNALLPSPDIAKRPPLFFPFHPRWGDFSTAFTDAHLGLYLRNSAIVSIAIVVAELATSILAGYAFAQVKFSLKGFWFMVCLATLMVPMEATIVPNHDTIVSFGWFNTYAALIVPFLASGIGIFLFRQVFLQMPKDLIEAARLEGYGHWKFLWKVGIPMNRPMIAAFGLFAFLGAWNQYLWPLVVTQTNSVRTVQIGLRQLESVGVDHIDIIFAGTVLAALPIFVLLVIFQKQLVRGLSAGALKG